MTEAKAVYRQISKQRRLQVTPEEYRRYSEELCRRLEASPAFKQADQIWAFYPSFGEPDLAPLLKRLLIEGRPVALPRCLSGAGEMQFFRLSSWEDCVPGRYGIPEPPAQNPAIATPRTCCLVPGLSFDQQGFRLGYGGGYYDRFLSDFPGFSVGVCFADALTEALPHEPHDRPVGAVVTQREWRMFLHSKQEGEDLGG